MNLIQARSLRAIGLSALLICFPAHAEDSDSNEGVSFTMKVLTIDTNEGCDIGDMDGDGKMDVVAGRNWFRNGDWLPRPVRTFGDKNGYANSNADFVYDVNQDGKMDIIAGGFFEADIHWYENPGNPKLLQGHLWTAHKLATTEQTSNEFTMMHDFDKDGTPEWISNSWIKTSPLKIWQLKKEKDTHKLVSHNVGPANGHGMAVGDLNNDGHADILVGSGWYEGSADGPFADKWKLHKEWDQQFSCPMAVRDINGDGKNDVVWGNPHNFGLFVWLSQGMQDGKWKYEERKLDESFSQLHCLHFADLDGDGKEELITGKRIRAHNGRDPGAGDPPIICYFKISPELEITRHVIHRGQAGTGLQIRSGDIDNDGDIDLVCAGKDGTEIFFNQRVSK